MNKSRSKKKKNTKSNSLSRLFNVALIFALLIMIASVFFSLNSKDDPMGMYVFGFKPMIIKSDIFEPEISKGSFAVVKKADYEDIKENDIITYVADKEMFMQKVHSVGDYGIRTFLDNSVSIDSEHFIEPESSSGALHVGGKVIFTSPSVALMIVLSAFIFIIPIVLIVIALTMISKRLSRKEQERTARSNPIPENNLTYY